MRSATTRVLAAATASTLALGLWATAFAGTAQAQTGAGAGAAAKNAAAKGKKVTDFALQASGFGTRVTGGQVPTGSDQTAFTAIGCANRAGVERENHVAEATLPGAGKISGVKTRLWTKKSGGAVHSYAENTTANVVLAQSGLGRLEISGVRSWSHAWHDAKGFHAERQSSVAKIRFKPPVGPAQEFEIPVPGQPIDIPGLARIAFGGGTKFANDRGAVAINNVLLVKVYPTNTTITVGRATARAYAGAKHGTFHGSSAATEVSAVDGTITSGRNPLSLMPCQGTDGKLKTKETASLNLGNQIVVSGLSSAQRAEQKARKSVAMERGKVAGINIGDGQLVVDGVVGQVNVTRRANGKVTSNIKGTTIGAITVNGEAQEFPDTGVLEIPGLLKLEPKVVEKSKFGISVVALRITLLDGTGAVIDLGSAKARIR